MKTSSDGAARSIDELVGRLSLEGPDVAKSEYASHRQRRGMSVLRILIADDHDLMRRGIRSLLESCGWTICAEAARGPRSCRKGRPIETGYCDPRHQHARIKRN